MKDSPGGLLGAAALVIGTVAVLAGAGCAPLISRAEKALQDRLPKLIGPADDYGVEIADTPLTSLASGRVSRLRIEGKGVRRTGFPTIEHLQIEAADVDVDVRAGKLRSVGRTDVTLDLVEADLREYLHRRFDRDVDLKIADGQAELFTRYPVAGIKVPISADVTLVLRGTGIVEFKITRINVARLPIPAALARLALSSYNPLLDTADLPFRVDIREIKLHPGGIRVVGSARDYLDIF